MKEKKAKTLPSDTTPIMCQLFVMVDPELKVFEKYKNYFGTQRKNDYLLTHEQDERDGEFPYTLMYRGHILKNEDIMEVIVNNSGDCVSMGIYYLNGQRQEAIDKLTNYIPGFFERQKAALEKRLSGYQKQEKVFVDLMKTKK